MITQSSDFIGDIYLPQVGASASTMVNDNDLLDNFINDFEPELLKKAFGRKLYSEFKTNIETGRTLIVGADQKWDDLLNGSEYEINGVTYYWRGLIDEEKSMTSYYVYCKMLQGKIEQQTTLGTVKAEAKNAVSVLPTHQIVRAWRKLNEWYQGGGYSQPSVYFHRGVYVEDYFNGDDNSKDVSLYTFLQDNKDSYNDWSFTPIENKNSWGL